MQAQDKCVAMAEQLLEKEAALQKAQADADNEKATGRRNKKSERLRELEAQVRPRLFPLPPPSLSPCVLLMGSAPADAARGLHAVAPDSGRRRTDSGVWGLTVMCGAAGHVANDENARDRDG